MPGCEHVKTEFMMRRDGVDYLRCIQCDSVFEAEDLESSPDLDDDDDEEDGPAVGKPRSKKVS